MLKKSDAGLFVGAIVATALLLSVFGCEDDRTKTIVGPVRWDTLRVSVPDTIPGKPDTVYVDRDSAKDHHHDR